MGDKPTVFLPCTLFSLQGVLHRWDTRDPTVRMFISFASSFMTRQYITTAIDYPNAPPHMGHVLEKVLADVCARWLRLRGDGVWFQIGTDEHGIKIQRAAEEEGISPKELLDRNVPMFEDLYQKLHISFDMFIRTSDQQVHWPTVIELWKRLKDAGMLEKKKYTGLYCSGCERFMTKRDLENDLCPNHKKAPEEVAEENWFFLLSKESNWLIKILKDTYRIVPDFRARETLSLVEHGLEDVSFSRPRESLSWGIPVPRDEEQTMYVWCDALTNYISGLDYFGLAKGHERSSKMGVEWWDDAQVTHVIGKDIARFHALYWPAMLKHANVRIPDRLLIHGFLTSEGQKMSKSLGNVVVPDDVIEKYGVDPLRFYLSHEIPVGRDGDFSWDRLGKLYDAKLRNDLGNLLNRVLVLLNKDGGELGDMSNPDFISVTYKDYQSAMNTFELSSALQIAMKIASDSNKYIDAKEPWKLANDKKKIVLSQLAEALRHLSLALLPFMPETAQKMSKQLNVPYADNIIERDFVISGLEEWGGCKEWKRVGKPEILFAPIE
jgi:methionyl-tRNA synthetase